MSLRVPCLCSEILGKARTTIVFLDLIILGLTAPSMHMEEDSPGHSGGSERVPLAENVLISHLGKISLMLDLHLVWVKLCPPKCGLNLYPHYIQKWPYLETGFLDIEEAKLKSG